MKTQDRPGRSGPEEIPGRNPRGQHTARRPRLTRIRPLALSIPEYVNAVARGEARGDLTSREADALRDLAGWIGTAGRATNIVAEYGRHLDELATATIPERARTFARWTPFDPTALRRAARRVHRHGKAG
jgi:hypothetical protein